MRPAPAEGEQAGDDRQVPQHRRGVAQEEAAVAVEDPEAPRGQNEQPRARKENADEAEIFGHRLRVLSLDKLMASKQAAGRPKDVIALAETRSN